MPAAPRPLCEQTYALRLLGPTGEASTLAGELEHVLSGDCVAFQSGAGLLAALVKMQAQIQAQKQAQKQAQQQAQRGPLPASADQGRAAEG